MSGDIYRADSHAPTLVVTNPSPDDAAHQQQMETLPATTYRMNEPDDAIELRQVHRSGSRAVRLAVTNASPGEDPQTPTRDSSLSPLDDPALGLTRVQSALPSLPKVVVTRPSSELLHVPVRAAEIPTVRVAGPAARWTGRFTLKHNNRYQPDDGPVGDVNKQITRHVIESFLELDETTANPFVDPLDYSKLKMFFDTALNSTHHVGNTEDFVLYDERQDINVNPRNPRSAQRVGFSDIFAGDDDKNEGYQHGLQDEVVLSDKIDLMQYVDHLQKKAETGARRRTVHCPDMKPGTAVALAVMCPRWYAPTLKTFLAAHIEGKAAFEARTSNHFVLTFHIPFFALRCGFQELDPRLIGPKRLPLRSANILPLHHCPMDPETPEFFHEAQLSLLIVGLDDWQWTAYSAADTYFEPPNRLAEHEYLKEGYQHAGNPDGPAAGRTNTFEGAMWNPREYFLVCLARRIHQARLAYTVLFDVVGDRMRDFHRDFNRFETVPPGRRASQQHLLATLRRFRAVLAETTGAWRNFERHGLAFFAIGPAPAPADSSSGSGSSAAGPSAAAAAAGPSGGAEGLLSPPAPAYHPSLRRRAAQAQAHARATAAQEPPTHPPAMRARWAKLIREIREDVGRLGSFEAAVAEQLAWYEERVVWGRECEQEREWDKKWERIRKGKGCNVL